MSDDAEADLKEKALGEARGHYGNYQEYNKLLRTWFVAFGIGLPALLYSRPDILERLGESQRLLIIWALLIGSVIQVVVAFMNKYCSWHDWDFLNRQSKNPALRRSSLEGCYHWLSNQIWIDKWADRVSAVSFLYSLIVVVMTALQVAEPTVFVPPP
jgi:hypothetical protein